MSRYDVKREVGVTPFKGATFKYGFLTNIDAADGVVLGHVAKADVTGPIVFGANSPKPARATKEKATGTVSSFIDVLAIPAARSARWSIGKGKNRTGGTNNKVNIVYVTIEGIKYAWPLPKLTQSNLGDISVLGIKLATAEDKDLVFGAKTPKPPRATKRGGDSSFSTYYDPSVTLPAGWRSTNSKTDVEKSIESQT